MESGKRNFGVEPAWTCPYQTSRVHVADGKSEVEETRRKKETLVSFEIVTTCPCQTSRVPAR
jgi:hypothetical protein